MLGKLIIALMLLASVSSAETIQFGNYTATFNMSQPHIIDKQAHAAEIKTFDGKIELLEGGKKSYDARFIGMVNEYSMSIFSDVGYVLDNRKGDYFIFSTLNLTSTIDFIKTVKVEKIKGK